MTQKFFQTPKILILIGSTMKHKKDHILALVMVPGNAQVGTQTNDKIRFHFKENTISSSKGNKMQSHVTDLHPQ